MLHLRLFLPSRVRLRAYVLEHAIASCICVVQTCVEHVPLLYRHVLLSLRCPQCCCDRSCHPTCETPICWCGAAWTVHAAPRVQHVLFFLFIFKLPATGRLQEFNSNGAQCLELV